MHLTRPLLIPLFIAHVRSPAPLMDLLPCCSGRSIFCSSGGNLLNKADLLLSRALCSLVFLGYPPPLPPMWCGQRDFGGQRWCRRPVCSAWPPRRPRPGWCCHWFSQTDSGVNIATAFVFFFVIVVIVAAVVGGGPLKLFSTFSSALRLSLTSSGVCPMRHSSAAP